VEKDNALPIAVALANHPDILLADELTGELDTATAEQVIGPFGWFKFPSEINLDHRNAQ